MSSSVHPFMRIADHYRALILTGELRPGEQLPSIREMARRWEVASATVSHAISHLLVEGYVRTSPRGTYVADDASVAPSSRDRLGMIRQSRSLLAMEETSRVISAQIVKPQLYVQELFGIEPGDQVVRREFIAGRGQSRTLYGVTFYSAELAALVPDLLNTAPGRNGGLLAKVLDATGRVITHARDDMHARAANRVEANHLGLPVGAPILAGVHRWSDADGLIEYGEWCIPTGIVVGYEYNPRA